MPKTASPFPSGSSERLRYAPISRIFGATKEMDVIIWKEVYNCFGCFESGVSERRKEEGLEVEAPIADAIQVIVREVARNC